jgi:hypothetical protein
VGTTAPTRRRCWINPNQDLPCSWVRGDACASETHERSYLCASVCRRADRGGARALEAAGAFRRLSELLQWAALTFAPLAPEPDLGPSVASPGALGTPAASYPQSEELRQVFAALWEWVWPLAAPLAGSDGTPRGSSVGGQAPAQAHPLLAPVLGSVLGALGSGISAQQPSEALLLLHTRSATALCRDSCALQHYALYLATALLGMAQHGGAIVSAEAGAAPLPSVHGGHVLAHLAALRSAGFWGAAFGPAFFLWSQPAVVVATLAAGAEGEQAGIQGGAQAGALPDDLLSLERRESASTGAPAAGAAVCISGRLHAGLCPPPSRGKLRRPPTELIRPRARRPVAGPSAPGRAACSACARAGYARAGSTPACQRRQCARVLAPGGRARQLASGRRGGFLLLPGREGCRPRERS